MLSLHRAPLLQNARVSWVKADSSREQGENCLARTDEYNKLNQITAVYAMRTLYPSDINPYVNYIPNDPKWAGRPGGEYWAYSLYMHVLTSRSTINSIIIPGGVNGDVSISFVPS